MRFEIGKQTRNNVDNIYLFIAIKLFTMVSVTLLSLSICSNTLE